MPHPLRLPSLHSLVTTTTDPVAFLFGYAQCMWNKCTDAFETQAELGLHVTEHMAMESGRVCLWRECKDNGEHHRNSSWLARHIKVHTGMKAYVVHNSCWKLTQVLT